MRKKLCASNWNFYISMMDIYKFTRELQANKNFMTEAPPWGVSTNCIAEKCVDNFHGAGTRLDCSIDLCGFGQQIGL